MNKIKQWLIMLARLSQDYSLIILGLIIWQMLIVLQIIPDFLLPSPTQIIQAFIREFPLLATHAQYTLSTAFLGIGIGLLLSFILAILMDLSKPFERLIYPMILLNQTIPTIAIAPLLVIWLGYGILPKVVLVVLSVFFPMTIALLDGFKSVGQDEMNLFKSMKATQFQIYKHLKLPSSMSYFFTGLKVAMSYALISAVVAEWLGGYYGLGVYMTRVRKSYALDNMFAVIFLISFLTIVLISVIKILERMVLSYKYVR